MLPIEPFTDEQLRHFANLEQQYQVWIEAERAYAALPYDLRRKRVGDYEYLYEIDGREGNGTSLGRMDAEREARLAAYRNDKEALKRRRTESKTAMTQTGRLLRALRVPLLASRAGELLREADRRSLLGSHLLVIGTNAIAAYAVEAAGRLRDAPDETEDFDLAWSKAQAEPNARTLWSLLKAVDPTYTVNSERPFQARNASAYEVEILVAPSRAAGMFGTDQPRPIALPEQEWLLRGCTVDRVVVCRDASPARIVAPDPRWFALHKLWLSRQDKRNPLKRTKDAKQGRALLDAVAAAMPAFPLDAAFEAELPDELRADFAMWRAAYVPGPAQWR
jgi:hypothetical protein